MTIANLLAIPSEKFHGGANLTDLSSLGLSALLNQFVDKANETAGVLNSLEAAFAARSFKDACRLATAGALPACTYSAALKTLSADANGALSVDGVAVAVGDRILVKTQAAGLQNGIYVVTAAGAAGARFVLTRASDADVSSEIKAGFGVWVNEGTANGDTSWMLSTNDPITLGTTALTFVQTSGLGQITAGAGLTKTGSTIDAVAGDGIAVAADAISVALAAASGLAFDAGLLKAQDIADAHIAAAAAIAASKISGTAVVEARQVATGNGLTGGGDLSADRTLAVQAEAAKGIAVGAAGVSVQLEADKGLQVAAAGLSVKVEPNEGIMVGAAGVAVDYDGFTLAMVGNKLAIKSAAFVSGHFAGRNGAGAVVFAGAKVGDVVLMLTNITDAGSGAASFEAAITVAGEIQQTAVGDLSTKNFSALLLSRS